MRFLSRRLIHAVLLVFGVSILTFLFTALAPGDYFAEMRLNPQIAPETVTALRAQYQLDRALPVRYARWVESAVPGDLGFSFSYNSPVGPLLWVRARNTLLLTVTATLLAWGLALPLGVWSAERQGALPDTLISWTMAGLLVVPDLALALRAKANALYACGSNRGSVARYSRGRNNLKAAKRRERDKWSAKSESNTIGRELGTRKSLLRF